MVETLNHHFYSQNNLNMYFSMDLSPESHSNEFPTLTITSNKNEFSPYKTQ